MTLRTVCILLALLLPGLAMAQEEVGEEPAPAVPTQPASEEPPPEFDLSPIDGETGDLEPSNEEDFELIEGLLEEGNEVMDAPSAYDPGDRRDPFRSLIRATNDRDDAPRGPRPEGVPGLLIDEISVTGVWVTPDGPVAQVQSTDTPMSFLLREGDQLYDGESQA